MENIRSSGSHLETAVNITVLVVALLLGTILVRNYLFHDPRRSSEILDVGETLPLPSTTSLGSTHTIVLALSTTCHFCAESVPFYRRLVEKARQKSVPVVVAFPQSAAEVAHYLEINNLEGVHSEPGIKLKLGGTPTLFFLNNKSVVTDVWRGKLPQEIENEVLSKF